VPQDEVKLIGWDRENGIGIGGKVGLSNMAGCCEDDMLNGVTSGSELERQTEAINAAQNDK
jgi:hypothetical protein